MRRWADVYCGHRRMGVNFSVALIMERRWKEGVEPVTLIVPILSIILLSIVLLKR